MGDTKDIEFAGALGVGSTVGATLSGTSAGSTIMGALGTMANASNAAGAGLAVAKGIIASATLGPLLPVVAIGALTYAVVRLVEDSK